MSDVRHHKVYIIGSGPADIPRPMRSSELIPIGRSQPETINHDDRCGKLSRLSRWSHGPETCN